MAVARAVLVLLASTAQAWMPDANARIHIKYGDETSEQFVGNATAPDYFRILDKDDFSIIVGGRNTVYNLSLYDLSENLDQRLEWQSTDAHRELCQLKGKSADECQNYPRVAARSHGRLMVCGTNAFKPLCRRYARHPPTHHLEEFDGSGRCPYDPQHNSTAIFAAIAVHPQVQAMNGNKYDVIYVGTDDGRVIKSVNVASNEGVFDSSTEEDSRSPVRTAVISEVQVLPQGVPIKQMHVALTTEKLIIASGDIIKAVSLSHCGNVQSCRECVALQDPHCAWDSKQQQCAWVGNRQFPNPERFLQNVEHGKTEICNKLPALLPGDRHSNRNPGTKKPVLSEPDTRKTDDIQNEILIEVVETNVLSEEKTNNNKHETDSLTVEAADGNIYSAQALMTAVVASCLVTLMASFYDFEKLSPLETPLNANSAYMPPRSKNVNMVANVCPLAKQDNLHLELGKERTLDLRNSTESLDKDLKCGTLQKVKKTYI
ncbi:hypothetical protein MSG28_011031 [Choristoneura fumiferana]|uniref:Uncharacterized protein n=1 Tax=Choristoneura fumiferana TaxID=7141 RepID=A0ACC0KQM7_CHOFU|nr:hypothetical protein MSG28_011031 [Choristoneura fumiferana]